MSIQGLVSPVEIKACVVTGKIIPLRRKARVVKLVSVSDAHIPVPVADDVVDRLDVKTLSVVGPVEVLNRTMFQCEELPDGQFIKVSGTEGVSPVNLHETRFPGDGVIIVKNLTVGVREIGGGKSPRHEEALIDIQ